MGIYVFEPRVLQYIPHNRYLDFPDLVLRLIENGESAEQIVAAGFDRALVDRVTAMVFRNEYKRRQMPPGLIVTRKAFGPGRRYPIAQRYRG